MRVTVDLSAEDFHRAERELHEAAREERVATGAVQSRATVLAVAAALILLGVCALDLFWLDDRWKLSETERWTLRVLLITAASLLTVALIVAMSAASPVGRRRMDDLLEVVGVPPPPQDRQRELEVLFDGVHKGQLLRLQRGRLLGAAFGLFVAGLIAVAAQGVVFAVAAGEEPNTVKPPPRKPDLDALALAHAPLIGIHTREVSGPIDPAMYLRRAALRWRRPGADRLVARPGKVRAERIGGGCLKSSCPTVGPYLPFQLTRPHRRDPRRPLRLSLQRGFYLEGADSLRPGQLVSDPPVPLFYDARYVGDSKRVHITYWAFFAHSKPFRTRPRPRGVEGDWEPVTVDFDPKLKPAAVLLTRSLTPHDVGWSKVEKRDGTHPVLYATARTHELSTNPLAIRQRAARTCVTRGRRRVCDRHLRNDDLAWRPWVQGGVLPVRRQGWYGFGGAWGHAGTSARRTGPLGPSDFVRGP